MKTVQRLLNSTRPLIFGMIHVPALPGTPLNRFNIKQISSQVVSETRQYARTGIDGIIFENMHDLPYVTAADQGPETVSAMTRICVDAISALSCKERDDLLLGVQILAAANKEALAVAHAADLDFIRAESFVFGHVADEGMMNACCGVLLRYRRQINADNIAVLADVKKKHSSHAITADISIGECAHAAEFQLADGLIVTGTATGSPAQTADLKAVRQATKLPVLIGSGIDHRNFAHFMQAHAFIIGSHFKRDGSWQNELDEARIDTFVSLVKATARKTGTASAV